MSEKKTGNKKIAKIKFFILKKYVFIKILLSYIIIGSTLIALLSTLLFIKFSQNSIREINDFSVTSLQQAVRTFDTLWNTAYLNMNKEVRTNGTLIEALDSTEFDPLKAGEVSRELDDIVASNNLFYSIYIYNPTADLVFSSIGTATNSKEFYDQGIIDVLSDSGLAVSGINDTAVAYRKMVYKYGTTSYSKNVISVIFSDDALHGAIVFNIDQSIFQNLITTKPEQNGSFLIINKDGLVISGSKAEDIYTNISDRSFVKKIMSKNIQNGYLVDYVDNNKSLVTYNRWDKWNNLGWIILNINDYDKLFTSVKQIQRTVLVFTLAFMLLSILISVFFIENIYAPIKKILGKFQVRESYIGTEKLNECVYLEKVYDTLVQTIDSLQTYKNTSKMAVKKEFLLKLLNGELAGSDMEIYKRIQELSLQISGNEFLAVVFKFDFIKRLLADNSMEDIALLRFSVCNISEEIFGEVYRVETVESGDDNISVIIGFEKSDEATISGIKECILKIQEACREHLKLSFSAGIGSAEDSIGKTCYSYENALDALSYKYVIGAGAVIDYLETVETGTGKYEYPFDIEKNIIEGFKSGDESKVKAALEVFMDRIGRFSYDEARLAISQLIVLSLRTIKSLPGSEEAKMSGKYTGLKAISGMLDELESITEMKEWLLSFYQEAINQLKKKKENRYEDIVLKVQNYVDMHYRDPNISVDLLSEMVKLSPNYLRMVFKENTGKSLSAYINDVRFGKVMELLIQTDEPASKIAETTGFQGGAYFYTAFKRTVGMSPDEFRRINRKKQL